MENRITITGSPLEIARKKAALEKLNNKATTEQLEKLAKLVDKPFYVKLLNSV